jgi:two-component system LytT family sensor kinase
VSFLIPQMFFQLYPWDDWSIFLFSWLEAACFTAAFWFTFRVLMVALRKRYPAFEQNQRRLLILIVIFIFVVPIVSMVLGFIMYSAGMPDYHEPSFYQSQLSTYFISFTVLATYEAIYFYTRLKASILETEAVKQAQIRSELQGLRNQVNPHFLFNSLNTLMHIVEEDSDLAKRFLQRLSKVYRYILESRDAPLIPLRDELAFIKAYVFLQEERFRGNLRVEIVVDELFYDYQIVPLSLQILFENAIKHNIISSSRPLTIEVYVDEHVSLVVTNNLQRKQQVLNSTKVGLENVSQRYRYFTERQMTITETEERFTVALPLIHPHKKPLHARTDH